MTKDLNITLVQKDLVWEDAQVNRDRIDEMLGPVSNTDLVLLPEMFTTGFTMASEKFAESMKGTTVQWMREMAQKMDAAICGSLIIEDNGFYNRMLFAHPNGIIDHYDKRHLFRMAGETDHFSSGQNRNIIRFRGWNMCLQVCYDLRFPVFSKNIYKEGSWEYDLLIYAANWPSPRSNAWRTLTEARAHENQCYVAAVNRVGTDGTGLSYSGDSALISPKGEFLLKFEGAKEEVKSSSISYPDLSDLRKKFPIGEDADDFTIRT